jgi:hypothetical protein
MNPAPQLYQNPPPAEDCRRCIDASKRYLSWCLLHVPQTPLATASMFPAVLSAGRWQSSPASNTTPSGACCCTNLTSLQLSIIANQDLPASAHLSPKQRLRAASSHVTLPVLLFFSTAFHLFLYPPQRALPQAADGETSDRW